jgi:hypothetical protein
VVPALLYVVSREADTVNGWRFALTCGIRHCRPWKPRAAPASNSRVDQKRDETRHISVMFLLPCRRKRAVTRCRVAGARARRSDCSAVSTT